MGVRRVEHHDRRGRLDTVLVWHGDGALATASVRLPDGTWVSIEPRAGDVAPWGPVDRLWHGPAAETRTRMLTVFGAVDWQRITMIPPLAEPARLPSGAGTTVLNLIATLAQTHGVARLTYRGPYPTEALFLALLESFRPSPGTGDALARFMTNEVAWTPAPFTSSLEPAAYVQWREGRVEKVVWDGRAYYREDWGAVRRRAPLRVHDDLDGVRCSLWALGAPLAPHLLLDADGVPRVVLRLLPERPEPVREVPAVVRDGLVEAVVALSAAPLGGPLREIMAPLAMTCGPLTIDLVRVSDDEIRVSTVFAAALRRTLAGAGSRAVRAQQALGALSELASAMADPLRVKAQAHLATAPGAAQIAALEASSANVQEQARRITAAVAAMLASGGVGDQPDVERDEPEDRDH